MSSTAAVADPEELGLDLEGGGDKMDETNHDLPARSTTNTMISMGSDEEGEQQAGAGDKQHKEIEDPATMAASEELRHTSLSDDKNTMAIFTSSATATEQQQRRGLIQKKRVLGGAGGVLAAGKGKGKRPGTPDSNGDRDEEMRERISSPKKKRGRDEVADEEEGGQDEYGDDEPSSSADGSVNGGRTTRDGPEKKRPRDTSGEVKKAAEEKSEALKVGGITSSSSDSLKGLAKSAEDKSKDASTGVAAKDSTDKPQTSPSAFASSGFASLAASSTSGFGALDASKPSIFGGSATSSASGFGALASKSPPAASTGGFGSGLAKPSAGFGFGSSTPSSGFGGLASGSGFGSALGNGFAGGSGPKLSSFAAPGKENTIVGAKPAKAFGAPESDEDEDSDGEGSEGGNASDDEEHVVSVEDKKKTTKIAKVHVDDGEAGEATLLQLRAKLFALESKEVGWKERGVGTLKINVPKSCVTFEENGLPIPGSFDISGLEEDDDPNAPRVARLIMRQENTHRVILNTIIVRAMEFQEKPGTSTAQILFTAFEGEKEAKPINMLLKMSDANARLFRSEIDSIQHEL